MSERWKEDVAAIFIAVVLAEVTVILLQSGIPFLAERVRIQRDVWFAPQEAPGNGSNGGQA